MKKCNYCRKELSEELFIENNKEYKICNKCREYHRLYKRKNINKITEELRIKRREYIKKYRLRNLDKAREYDKLYKKRYRDENPEEYFIKRKAYEDKNYDRLKPIYKNRIIDRPGYFLFSSARQRARYYNLEFSITEQDVKNLLDITEKCPLRDVYFERGYNHKAVDNSISLDRIDSSKGYTVDNIQIISYRANVVKNNLDLNTFRRIVNGLKYYKVVEHNVDPYTRKIIIEDRLNQLKNDDRRKKYKVSLLDLEGFILNRVKKRAKRDNLDINIDKNYLYSIFPIDNKCPILGEKFILAKGFAHDLSASIDRIDNSKGYIKGNIAIISHKANSVKNKLSISELELMLENWEQLESKRNNK